VYSKEFDGNLGAKDKAENGKDLASKRKYQNKSACFSEIFQKVFVKSYLARRFRYGVKDRPSLMCDS